MLQGINVYITRTALKFIFQNSIILAPMNAMLEHDSKQKWNMCTSGTWNAFQTTRIHFTTVVFDMMDVATNDCGFRCWIKR
eukprot:gene671-1818_t